MKNAIKLGTQENAVGRRKNAIETQVSQIKHTKGNARYRKA